MEESQTQEPGPKGSHQLITIAVYANPHQGHLAQGLLQANGIPAFVLDENVVRMAGPRTGLIEGVRLQVREVDWQEALELLNLPPEEAPLDLTTGELSAPEESAQHILDNSTDACPLCGSPLPGVLENLLGRLRELFAGSADSRDQRCSQCGTVRHF